MISHNEDDTEVLISYREVNMIMNEIMTAINHAADFNIPAPMVLGMLNQAAFTISMRIRQEQDDFFIKEQLKVALLNSLIPKDNPQ